MPTSGNSVRFVRILLTAAEAYPALEKEFLAARTEIWASFATFDLTTRLRSPEARRVGDSWFDLVVHTLNRGVALNVFLGDVDPIARPALHRSVTRQLRMFSAAAAVAAPGAKLVVACHRHPAQAGLAVRLAFWPYLLRKLFVTGRWLNRLTAERRSAALRDMPEALQNFRHGADGTVSPRFFSLPHLYPVTHHQKLTVFDRKLLYIGGLDVDDSYYDTPNHGRPAEQTWHDVQLLMAGRVAAEAQLHLETFRAVTADTAVAPPMRNLLRTLSCARPMNLTHFGPKPVISDLRQAHVTLLRRTRHLIYLENQYFRDRGLARDLADQARSNPGLGMILILPAAPDEVAFDRRRGIDVRYGEALQASALRILRQAFGKRLFVGSPAQPRRALPDGGGDKNRRDRLNGAPVIYVHAKVSVFDDNAAIVSSANLNGRSLMWDTEAGVYLYARHDVTELRHRVMAHWLPKDARAEAFAPETAVAAWARIAHDNARIPPDRRDGFLLPHDFAAAEAFGRNLPLVPEEVV